MLRWQTSAPTLRRTSSSQLALSSPRHTAHERLPRALWPGQSCATAWPSPRWTSSLLQHAWCWHTWTSPRRQPSLHHLMPVPWCCPRAGHLALQQGHLQVQSLLLALSCPQGPGKHRLQLGVSWMALQSCWRQPRSWLQLCQPVGQRLRPGEQTIMRSTVFTTTPCVHSHLLCLA